MSISLRSLSNHQLLSRTKTLTLQERRLTLNLLLHLNEVERRKLFLKSGFASMFTYCTAGLGYSASAAKTAHLHGALRCAIPRGSGPLEIQRRQPEHGDASVQDSEARQCRRRSWRIRGKSQREVEAIVAEYEPLAVLPRERVRTVVVRVPVRTVTDLDTAKTNAPEFPAPEPAVVAQDRNGPETTASSQPAMQFERRAVVQFSAREEVMTKLEDVRALASHRLAINAPLEQLVEFLADYFIAREDPKTRHERRRGEAAADTKGRRPSRMQESATDPCHNSGSVFVRDQQQCTFIGRMAANVDQSTCCRSITSSR